MFDQFAFLMAIFAIFTVVFVVVLISFVAKKRNNHAKSYDAEDQHVGGRHHSAAMSSIETQEQEEEQEKQQSTPRDHQDEEADLDEEIEKDTSMRARRFLWVGDSVCYIYSTRLRQDDKVTSNERAATKDINNEKQRQSSTQSIAREQSRRKGTTPILMSRDWLFG
ncbi:hypothetical protein B0T20DRAFT_391535 [Sordaria brevicollis]|uniref:Uncharacterized protein n=1 Tax=Sordaria brevicollis TaxID=83679 RepID=A0AAE0PI76_SORBR|nr:hypothetical protein B0T20DRAFT_391535 [Sordaria brevicollis]